MAGHTYEKPGDAGHALAPPWLRPCHFVIDGERERNRGLTSTVRLFVHVCVSIHERLKWRRLIWNVLKLNGIDREPKEIPFSSYPSTFFMLKSFSASAVDFSTCQCVANSSISIRAYSLHTKAKPLVQSFDEYDAYLPHRRRLSTRTQMEELERGGSERVWDANDRMEK